MNSGFLAIIFCRIQITENVILNNRTALRVLATAAFVFSSASVGSVCSSGLLNLTIATCNTGEKVAANGAWPCYLTLNNDDDEDDHVLISTTLIVK